MGLSFTELSSRAEVWVCGEPGQGSLRIYLPQIESSKYECEAIAMSPLIPPIRAAGTETLVEDEQTVRELARAVLEKGDDTILAACYVEGALRLSKGHYRCDHAWHARSRATSYAKLRPQIKILLVSGYTDDAATHQGVLADGIQFLQKPFLPDTLSANSEKRSGHWLIHGEVTILNDG